MRRISMTVMLVALSLVLSGCIRQEGSLVIREDGSVTGTVQLGIDRALAGPLGIATLGDLIAKNPVKQKEIENTCLEYDVLDSASEFILHCRYKNAILNQGDMTSKVENDRIIFTFKSNDTEPSDPNNLKLGNILLNLDFPGEIEKITENRAGLVFRKSTTQVKIDGYASEPMNVRIVAKCESSCHYDVGKMANSYTPAPKVFGGMVRTNTVMRKVDSPFRVNEMIQIPLGRTLLVEPGVEIVADLKSIQNVYDQSLFFNHGRLILAGTKEDRIRLSGDPYIFIKTSESTIDASVEASFVDFLGGGSLVNPAGYSSYSIVSINDSYMKDIRGTWYVGYPQRPHYIERNIFQNTGGIEILARSPSGTTLPSVFVRNNKFIGPPLDAKGKAPSGCWISVRTSYSTKVVITGNDFSEVSERAICAGSEKGIVIEARKNFWGTVVSKEIDAKIFDSDDAITSSARIDFSNPLQSNPLVEDSSLSSVLDYLTKLGEADRQRIEREKALAEVAAKALADYEAAQKAKIIKGKTITCIKGKTTKKVTGISPKCPSGFKKK